VIPF
jgi:hypothetical protein